MELGGIYLFQYKDDNKNNIKIMRPVVIVNISEENKVQIVPISSHVDPKFRVAWRICASIELNGKSRDVCILCDKMSTIEASELGKQVGYLDENSFMHVVAGAMYYKAHPNEKIEKVPIDFNKGTEKIIIVATEKELLEKAINGINSLTDKFDKANSRKEKWKERVISFVIGVISGIVATLIISG